MIQVRFIVLMFAFVTGCGGTGDSSTPARHPNVTLPVGTLDPIGKIAFSANLVRAESRLLSYNAGAARLSLIDPDAARELWGVTAPGFDFAVPFPDSQGAALFGADEIRVISGVDQQNFVLMQPYAHSASAANALAYALASSDGETLEVIRFLSNAGQWQHELFTMPWSNAHVDRPDGQPVLLASLFNAHGTLLIAFRPADGSYTLFSAANGANELINTGLHCAGDGVGTAEQATFRNVAWDEGRGVVYAGDRLGNLYTIDPIGGCATLTGIPTVALDGAAITQIAVTAPGELSVLQDNGRLHRLTFDGVTFVRTGNLTTPCAYPDGAITLAGGLHLVTCLSESIVGSGDYDRKEYLTLESGSDNTLARFSLAEAQSRNIVIDSTRRLMFRVEDNALGILLRYDLMGGMIYEQRGLFLEGILTGG